MKKYLIIFLTILIELACPLGHSEAQSVPGLTDVNSFSDLNKKRNDLNMLIPILEKKVEVINSKLLDEANISGDISRFEYDNEYFKNQIQKLKNLKRSDSLISSYEYSMRYNTNKINELQQILESNKKLYVERDTLTHEIGQKKIELSQTENQINMLMIPKLSQQNFMFWSSIAFVILMCIILVTFFYVLRQDSQIRIAIFGSGSGIQFITLFCIVIAIILFGLTQVLEGKELSALLGSIAGYILGKVNVSSPNNTNPGGNQGNIPNAPVA